ncbi:MAG TPA: J domain-containing protein [Pyrinomonadaceae bacterium]|nr:J domain-containing protein [Pyrinomonadaceae bacterium]
MNEESERYYELLGVRPGASAQELKEAYRDLAKVWHPDRFAHDPRLQQKAQEKLKEVNEAYERLTSGRGARRPRPAPAPDVPRAHAAATVTTAARKRPRVFLPTALVFCAAFVVALISFVPQGARPAPEQTPPAEREEAQPSAKAQQSEVGTHDDAGRSARGKERANRQSPSETTSADKGSEPGPQQLRPMQTVTVTVDAVNGMLATQDCPNVSTLTFPAGEQPRRYCTVQHKTKIVPPSEPAKASRLKSLGKSLATPFN